MGMFLCDPSNKNIWLTMILEIGDVLEKGISHCIISRLWKYFNLRVCLHFGKNVKNFKTSRKSWKCHSQQSNRFQRGRILRIFSHWLWKLYIVDWNFEKWRRSLTWGLLLKMDQSVNWSRSQRKWRSKRCSITKKFTSALPWHLYTGISYLYTVPYKALHCYQ